MQEDPQSDKSRSAATVLIGYLCMAITGVADSLGDTLYPGNFVHGFVTLEVTGIILMVAGLLAYFNRQAWDAALFVAGGISAWTYQAAAKTVSAGASGLSLSLPAGEPLSYQGWYFFYFSAFYTCLALASFPMDGLRKAFILVKATQFIAAAIACWFGIAILQPICGYIGFLSSIIATIIGASAMIRFGRPSDPKGAGAQSQSR
jgi:succinate-acetate transporter protein